MALKNFNPTTPSQRQLVIVDRSGLYKGKPVKDAALKHDFVNDPDQEPVKTDKDGVATIKVRNQGLNVLAATYVGPSDNPKQIDHIEYLATLSFVLPHAPE